MTKQAIIERTVQVINQLPEERAVEISDFADFIMKQYEATRLTSELGTPAATGQAFQFLQEEEDLYTEQDLKERYNGQR